MELFNAWSLARASELAYKKKDQVRSAVVNWGFENVETFGFPSRAHDNLTQAFVASNDDLILVSFRGTERVNWRDWLVNADIFFQEGPFGADVHGGFLKALKEPWKATTILDAVVAKVEDLSSNGRAVYLTGHSLGAALATLAAGYLLEKKISLTGVYTYGSPRVGSGDFAREYNWRARGLTHRFVNRQDVVTKLPLQDIGYWHIGTSWYIDENNDVSHPEWWKQVWDFFTQTVNGEPDLVTDHSITEGYVRSLRRALDDVTVPKGSLGEIGGTGV